MAKIVDIIKYEGDNRTFVWKHPEEDFNTLSQLIVHESQEALFMMNGQALDLFGPGRYTLSTQNIPLIGSALKLATDGKSPFHCEVYFINKTEQMAIKWGTDSKVQFVEPTYGFPLSIGASGEMSLRIEDSRKFLLKLVGTENALTREGLVVYFRAFLMTKAKAYLAQTIKAQKINIFEIDEHLEDLSEALRKDLRNDFADYGVELERFFVSNIAKPDGEAQYEKFKSLHFRQYADIMEAKLRQQVFEVYRLRCYTMPVYQSLRVEYHLIGYTTYVIVCFGVGAAIGHYKLTRLLEAKEGVSYLFGTGRVCYDTASL